MNGKRIKNVNELLAAKSARAVFMRTRLRDYFKVAAELTGREDMDKFDELREFTRLDPRQRIYLRFMYPDCETRDEPNLDVTVGEMLHAAQALLRHEGCLADPEDFDDLKDLPDLHREMDDCAIQIVEAIFAQLAVLANGSDE